MANDYTLALSSDGMIRDPLKRADNHLARFVVSEYTQTPYVENRTSLPYLLARFQEDEDGLAEAIQDTLTQSFLESFSQARIEVTVKPHPENIAWRQFNMAVALKDVSGGDVKLSRLVTMEGLKFIDIIKINNGSLPYTV